MTCYFNWSRYQPHQENIALMLGMGYAEGAEGAVSYSVFDPAWGLDFDILAEYAWNFRGAGPVHRFEEKWAQVRADEDVLEAIRWLDCAAKTKAYGILNYYVYTYPRPNKPCPRHYPEEPLAELADCGSDLELIAQAGKRAQQLLAGRTDELSRNLLAEAARIEAYGVFFDALRQIQEQIQASGSVDLDVEDAHAVLLEAMAIIEANKPAYMVPSYLRDLSVLYEFLLQLSSDIEQAGRGERAWAELRWFVAVPVAQRGIR